MVGRTKFSYFGICLFVVVYFLKTWRNLTVFSTTGKASFVNRIATPNEKPQRNVYHNGTDFIVNPWYGWQPPLHTPMRCSWLECRSENHNCSDCRDSPEDLNLSTTMNSSFLDPGENWVPDVTMLRRMYIDGHDANGDPWPPPLDDDLCKIHGTPELNTTKHLFDVVPIIGAKISKEENKTNRVFCMIYSMESSHADKIRAIRETWAPGCDGFLVFSTKSDPRIPAIHVPQRGREVYGNMWQKVRAMFQFVGKHYMDQFDWFYIGGDDLVVFPQNLKNYLATYNSSHPYYIGRRFKVRGKQVKNGAQGFNTGGAGYALSQPALRCMLEHFEEKGICYPKKSASTEDVLTAICLQYGCNITYEDTRDPELRERFHHFWPEWIYNYKGGRFWYKGYNKEWGLLYKEKCCSPETINFHYIKNPAMIRYIFHYGQNCNRSAS